MFQDRTHNIVIVDVHAVRATGIGNIYRITPLPQPLITLEYGICHYYFSLYDFK